MGGLPDGVPKFRLLSAARAVAGQQRGVVRQRPQRLLQAVPAPRRPRQHAVVRRMQQGTPFVLPQT